MLVTLIMKNCFFNETNAVLFSSFGYMAEYFWEKMEIDTNKPQKEVK